MNNFPNYYCKVFNEEYSSDGIFLTCRDISIPVKKGIPRFVLNEEYTASFGSQWTRYKITQLDSYTGTEISKKRLLRCLGEIYGSLSFKLVLEAGCGAGRFTEHLLKRDAFLMSVDMSSAVEINQENFPTNDMHQIIQADITDLPFADSQFDVVLCLGVVQHTPNPEATIEALYRQVKPDGYLVFDHYTYNLSHWAKTAGLFRFFLKRASPKKAIKVTELLVRIFFPLHRACKNNWFLQAILSRLSPVLTYYHTLPELSDRMQHEWAQLDTHDSLTDYYKHFRTRSQIENYLVTLGASEIMVSYGGNGVEARCKRPA